MDPDATLQAFIEAVREGALDAANEALDSLREWKQRGGFLPDGVTIPDAPVARISGMTVWLTNGQHWEV